MSDLTGSSSPKLDRLNVLSKNVSDAINEIFSMVYAQAYVQDTSPPPENGPDIRLIEKSLWINRIMIPLASRQKTLTLIQAFFRKDNLTLTKAEIISAVYGIQEHHSNRYVEAQEINLTKLLSRTRSFLEESLAHVQQVHPVDWLYFDIRTRKYQLYRLRSDFLNSR